MSVVDKLRARCRSRSLGHSKFLRRVDFSNARSLPCKMKETLDLPVFSQIGKTIKNLQCIPYTIINTSALECIDLLMDWETFN